MTEKIVNLGKNPKISEIVEWAEQNGFRVEIELHPKEPNLYWTLGEPQVIKEDKPSKKKVKKK